MKLPDYASHSTQDAWELTEFLRSEVEPLRPAVVAEVGVYAGGSLSAWAHAATDNALLVGVDDLSAKVTPYVHWRCSSQRIALIYGDTREDYTLQRVKDALQGRAVDFLFVDADHSEACCRNDMERFVPLVRPGGLVGMHDVIGNTDVNRVWQEYKARYGGTEYFRDGQAHRMGIGCFHLPV